MRIAARLAVQHEPQDDRRQAERLAVCASATMRALGYHGIDVVLRDISGEAFMAETSDAVAPGSLVRLRIPGLGAVLARIVWSKPGHVGGSFFNPVNDGQLRRIVGIGVR